MKVSVTVVPGAKVEQIQAAFDGGLKVWVRGKPVDGEANRAVIELLSKHYKVPKSNVRIVLGHTSRRKLVEISD